MYYKALKNVHTKQIILPTFLISVMIWITDFYLPTISMVWISCYWSDHLNKGLSVRCSGNALNSRPSCILTAFNHVNTRLVHYSDPHSFKNKKRKRKPPKRQNFLDFFTKIVQNLIFYWGQSNGWNTKKCDRGARKTLVLLKQKNLFWN